MNETTTNPDDSEGQDVDRRPEWVRDNRKNIEREAESDGPHAWVFESIRRTYFGEGDS